MWMTFSTISSYYRKIIKDCFMGDRCLQTNAVDVFSILVKLHSLKINSMCCRNNGVIGNFDFIQFCLILI